MRSAARIADAIRGQRKALLFVGSAAALLGVGAGASTATASAATVAAGHAPVVVSAQRGTAPGRGGAALNAAAVAASMAGSAAIDVLADQVTPASAHPAAHVPSASRPAARTVAVRTGSAGEHRPAKKGRPEARHDPKVLPAADQLRPVGLYGPQETMPLSSSQYGNALTIVKQAMAKRMGVRSAVIAVATSMQESMLNNISYGTSDSLGLFQQRPSCGWGTAQQIMDPAFSADAFLTALQHYQAANPDWAHQPLWQAAQGVQASGFPTAYAKWEAQAAGLVQHITTQLGR
jgi:hypothetical protein